MKKSFGNLTNFVIIAIFRARFLQLFAAKYFPGKIKNGLFYNLQNREYHFNQNRTRKSRARKIIMMIMSYRAGRQFIAGFSMVMIKQGFWSKLLHQFCVLRNFAGSSSYPEILIVELIGKLFRLDVAWHCTSESDRNQSFGLSPSLSIESVLNYFAILWRLTWLKNLLNYLTFT